MLKISDILRHLLNLTHSHEGLLHRSMMPFPILCFCSGCSLHHLTLLVTPY